MNFRNKFTVAAQTLGAAFVVAILVAACGGGGSPSGFVQSYTTSVGAGDVLQFSVDTTNMVYSFRVIDTSYASAALAASNVSIASAVSPTEASTGILSGRNAVGSYNVMPSADGFILGGEVYPVQNGVFVGHVLIKPFSGIHRMIPIFGVSTPVTSLANMSGEYNLQGFACAGRTGGQVGSASGVQCLNHYGTAWITASSVSSAPASGVTVATITTCRFGDLTTAATASGPFLCAPPVGNGTPTSTPTRVGTLIATGTPGVFDFQTADGKHRGWLFAFSTGGQNIAVIDHDDVYTPEFGHSVAVTQTSVQPGQIDGNYFVKNNIGGRHLLTISGTTYTDTLFGAAIGNLAYDTPWTGLVEYTGGYMGGASGVADVATAGAFTYTSSTVPYLFGVGLKY